MSAVADVLRFGFVELNANLALAFVLPVGVVLVFVVGVFGQPVFEVVCHRVALVVVSHACILPSSRLFVNPSVGRINPPATTAVVASVLSVTSAKLDRGQIVLAASPHLEATRLAGAMLVGVLTPTIVEVCLVCRWRVRPTVCSSEVRHCVALVGRVVVVCHVRIVPSCRLFVK